MERNRKLFYQIADILEAYPEKYDQDTWGEPVRSKKGKSTKFDKVIYDGKEIKCGTAHCIAGWAAAFSSDVKPKREKDYLDWAYVINEDGETHHTYSWATEELGLTFEESDILFDSDWEPASGMSPSDALRAIGDGASIEEVTSSNWSLYEDC